MVLDSDPAFSLKQAPPFPEDAQQPEFDQILDLSHENSANTAVTSSGPPPPATPLIAFEDSITASPKQEVPTAGDEVL